MTIRRMCNPQSFCKEAHKLNIRYEFLMEARECIGDQALAKLFHGSSMRLKIDYTFNLILFFS